MDIVIFIAAIAIGYLISAQYLSWWSSFFIRAQHAKYVNDFIPNSESLKLETIAMILLISYFAFAAWLVVSLFDSSPLTALITAGMFFLAYLNSSKNAVGGCSALGWIDPKTERIMRDLTE